MHFWHAFLHFWSHLGEYVWHWVEHYGYVGLFCVLFSCGLGFPLPEDIPLLAAGTMIANGRLDFALVALCAWCGIIGGDCVLYHIGKKFGDEVPKIPMVGKHVTLQRMRQVEELFTKWGIWVVAIGRMFAGIRGAMVVVAGASRFTFWKFVVADGLAAIVSGGLFLFLGYKFGPKIISAVERGKHMSLYVLLGAAVIVGLYIWYRKKRHAHHRAVHESAPVASPVPSSGTPGEG
ncbi:MAG TPA: DedA family protein [Humisphaera sp.]|jgi:membrane protein DedA with SNARE-associated domain|nr:DedA family protein [Humisphaera sp.]